MYIRKFNLFFVLQILYEPVMGAWQQEKPNWEVAGLCAWSRKAWKVWYLPWAYLEYMLWGFSCKLKGVVVIFWEGLENMESN